MDILVADGKVVGYFGEMLQSLAEMVGKENIHVTYENTKVISPDEVDEWLKFATSKT